MLYVYRYRVPQVDASHGSHSHFCTYCQAQVCMRGSAPAPFRLRQTAGSSLGVKVQARRGFCSQRLHQA